MSLIYHGPDLPVSVWNLNLGNAKPNLQSNMSYFSHE